MPDSPEWSTEIRKFRPDSADVSRNQIKIDGFCLVIFNPNSHLHHVLLNYTQRIASPTAHSKPYSALIFGVGYLGSWINEKQRTGLLHNSDFSCEIRNELLNIETKGNTHSL
jgi:hypothetical protein